MGDYFIKILILAAVSDGEIQKAELDLINSMRESHPTMREISDADVQNATVDIYNKLSAGMEVKQVIEQLGAELERDEKNSVYAIAKEVCAVDFKVLPAETEFLGVLEETWEITEDIRDAVNRSLALRYSL